MQVLGVKVKCSFAFSNKKTLTGHKSLDSVNHYRYLHQIVSDSPLVAMLRYCEGPLLSMLLLYTDLGLSL